jgi:signal transduction histidine kinase/ActR/RegA family two-component response regulator
MDDAVLTLAEYLPLGVAVVAHDRFQYVNPALARLLRIDRAELMEMDPIHVVEGWTVSRIRELITRLETGSASIVSSVERGLARGVEPIDVEIIGMNAPFEGEVVQLFLCVDLTRERSLKDQLYHAQKMHSVGQLAGGIAHDFNNILTGIAGNVGLVRDMLLAHDLPTQDLDRVRRLQRRAADLTQQLLAFARRQVIRPTPTDLNSLVADFVSMAKRLISERVTVGLTLDPGLPAVMADPGQLEQVLLNLTVNARDAMEDEGSLDFETRALPPSSDARFPRACVIVRDTGHGIPEHLRSRIFEPFYTRKEPGKGTGLGLSVVHGIVEQHHGSIELDSAPGRGTEFRVILPGVLDVPVRAESTEPAPARLPHREATLLVAEDDEELRHLVRTVLERDGYRVHMAADGEGAISLFRRHQAQIDLVLMDLVMPGVGGVEALSEIRAIAPDVPAVLMSGYAEEFTRGDGARQAQPHTFIAKPFSNEALLAVVRGALERDPE